MTVHRPDPDPLDADRLSDDDLAINAVADGTATDTQRRRVDADATMRQRVDEIIAVRAALAEPVASLPRRTAETMIRIAADATPLAAPASPARSDSTRWLVAAAVVILLALGAVALPRLTSVRSDSSDTASSGAVSSTTAPATAESNEDAERGPEIVSPAASAEPPIAEDADPLANVLIAELGVARTLEELISRAVTALDGPLSGGGDREGGTEASASAQASACLSRLAPDGDVVLVASGSVDDVDHLVVIVAAPGTDPATRSVLVVRSADCSLVGQFAR